MGQGPYLQALIDIFGQISYPKEVTLIITIDDNSPQKININTNTLEKKFNTREGLQTLIEDSTLPESFVVILAVPKNSQENKDLQIIFYRAYIGQDIQEYTPKGVDKIPKGDENLFYMWIRTGEDITDRYFCSIECIKNLEEDSKKDIDKIFK